MCTSVNPLKLRVWHQQHFLGVDKLLTAIFCEFKDVLQLNCTRRTGFLAEPAVDTPKHVDLIPLCIPFTRTSSVLICIFTSNDENGIGRTGTSTKRATNALFHAIVIAVEYVAPPSSTSHWPTEFRIGQYSCWFNNLCTNPCHPLKRCEHLGCNLTNIRPKF